jgi:trypsin
VTTIGLLVGEHNIKNGNETPYTVLLRISEFKAHPQFNSDTKANDIALIRTATAMTFTQGVQPVCLPFKYRSDSLVNRMVQALGW